MARNPCQDKQGAGHLVWHKVTFRGPVDGQPCELPENQQGIIEHEFINGSIYQQSFATAVSTQPSALQVDGSLGPPPVVVRKAASGWKGTQPTVGVATQKFDHVAGTGLGLPHTGTAEFTTTVTPPWGIPSSPATPPTISVTLTA